MDERPLAEVPIVIVDTETTGLSPAYGHRVVEIGAIRLEGWREVGRLNQLVNPGRPIEPGASRVNGIYDSDVADAPPFIDVAADLRRLMEGALLVAHNARFDASFLEAEFSVVAYQRPEFDAAVPNPWLCTLQLARNCFYFGRNNLGAIAARLGVRVGRAHRALNDVYVTAEILKRMARELRERRLHTVGDLLHAQGGPIYMSPPVAPDLPHPLAEAISGGKRVHIRYRSGARETRREISPLFAAENAGTLYLTAYCHLRQAQRTFRLDRILSAELIEGE
ncbi:MAG: exonuclease domain-containing protein [Candidatus Promineifilaceae bacterium]|nr:exonuclease domain-containing protein [Candidatus Promineifilaceae bacterium]